jgi:hypothetical protein
MEILSAIQGWRVTIRDEHLGNKRHLRLRSMHWLTAIFQVCLHHLMAGRRRFIVKN